jgi:hemolysin activation/secretion protein
VSGNVSSHPWLYPQLYQRSARLSSSRIIVRGLVLFTALSFSMSLLAAPPRVPLKRPSETPLDLPEFEPEDEHKPLALPPLPKAQPESDLSQQSRVYINRFQLTGNTVFSDDELAGILQPYEGREITSGELQAMRYDLTLFYVNHGYINSGAIIPDQTVTDNIITIQIIEGKLSAVDVSGDIRLKPEYVSKRIELGAGPPLNIVKLGERLQILQQDPRIEQLNATLEPGTEPGESKLNVEVKEAQPFQLWVGVDNHQSPSVGGEEGRIWGFHQDLTGHGDTLQFEYDHAEGLDEWNGSYAIPINAYDTTLRLYYDNIDSEVVERPFDDLDIESDEETFSLSLAQPFYLSVNQILTLGLSLDLRQNETFLLGDRFAFVPGTDNGKTNLTVIRFSQEWADRGRNQVLAARSMISTGIDAFGATVNDEPRDGEFVSWLGQFQWARRIGTSNSQFIFRTSAQAANGGLPPMEQFTVGGVDTVRGYRESRLVADTGIVASVEARVPVYAHPSGDFEVRVAPFIDYGYARNRYGLDPLRSDISSAGVGLLGSAFKRVHFNLYYGYAFQDFDSNDIQDDGFSFSLTTQLY